MSYRTTVEKLNSNVLLPLLIVAAQDVFLTEAAKNTVTPKVLAARNYLNNPGFNAERIARLAIVLDQTIDDSSPDSKLRKAVDDAFTVVITT